MKLNFSFDSMQKAWTQTSSQCPFVYLREIGANLFNALKALCKFTVVGIYWLFKNHPNITWPVIVALLIVLHFVMIGNTRAERDAYSHESALLLDSIQKINMEPVKYTTINGQPIQSLSPEK